MSTVIYRQRWTSAGPENIDCYIDITDMTTYVEGSSPEYRLLDGIGMRLESPRTDDMHDPIYSQRLTFSFRNTNNTYLHTFSQGDDKRWAVRFWYRHRDSITEFYDDHDVFVGFLNMDYNSEPYLPKGHPVTLTANDGIADLQNIDLVNFDDEKPTGKQSLKDILCWILRKTGVERMVNIMDNLFEINQDDRDVSNLKSPWDQTYVDILTFEESEIGSISNCYKVLETILRSRLCRLFFYDGQWYVQRIDELKNNLQHWSQYNPDGTISAGYKDINLMKTVTAAPPTAATDTVTFINAASVVKIKRARNKTKWLIDYTLPIEIICNINFERGPINFLYSNPTFTAYDPECWTLKEGRPEVTPVSTTGFIRRYFVDGYETDRHIVINPHSPAGDWFFESEPIPVTELAKFDFRVDVKYSGQIATGSGFLRVNAAQIRLYADDGTKYTLHGGTSVDEQAYWRQSSSDWSTNNSFIVFEGDGDDDDTQYRSATLWREWLYMKPIPKSGNITVCLVAQNSTDVVETIFDNLRFDYKPLINGSYSDYSGEHHQVSIGNVNKNYPEERKLYLFDSTHKIFKGAMFWNDAGVMKLTAKWNDWALARNATPGVGDTKIGKWLAWNLWDMYRREMVTMECDWRGFDVESKVYRGALHPLFIQGSTPATMNKKFMVKPVEQDWYTMQWRCIIYEVHDFILDDMRDFGASGALYEFKYLSRLGKN